MNGGPMRHEYYYYDKERLLAAPKLPPSSRPWPGR